jgi:hypothetical protein
MIAVVMLQFLICLHERTRPERFHVHVQIHVVVHAVTCMLAIAIGKFTVISVV